MNQPAVGRARVPGNCLPVARCVPHAALPRWGWGGITTFGLGLGQGKMGSAVGVWLVAALVEKGISMGRG